jgi:hypothetical protein
MFRQLAARVRNSEFDFRLLVPLSLRPSPPSRS